MKNRQWLRMSVCTAIIIANVGCGGGFESSSLTSAVGGSSTRLDPVAQTNLELNSLNSNIGSLNLSIADSQGQLDLITLTNLITQSANGPASDAGAKISDSISKFLDKVVNGVSKVLTQIDTVTSKIQMRMAKLDANVPAEAQVIAKLKTLLEDIYKFKAKVVAAVKSLAAKLDTLVTKLDGDISNISNTAVQILVEVIWQPVKAQINQHRDALLALVP